MPKRVLDYDPLTGVTTYFDHHFATDETTITREQSDVGIILDINKALQNNDEVTKRGIKDSWWPYAKIPVIVMEKWLTEHGVDALKKENWEKNGPVWKLLNDPEYRYLKTTTKMHRG